MNHGQHKESNFSKGLGYLLIGGGIGAAVALLFAPKAGSELREDISNAAAKGLDKTKETAGQLRETAGEYYSTAKEKASDAYQAAAEKASDVYQAAADKAGNLYGATAQVADDAADSVKKLAENASEKIEDKKDEFKAAIDGAEKGYNKERAKNAATNV